MVDWRAVGDHYVRYRLLRQGYVCSQVETGSATLLACNEDGNRVALLIVIAQHATQAWQVSREECRFARRNLSYVFVDFSGDELPPCFVVPSLSLARALDDNPSWSSPARLAEWLEPYHEAWGVLGLTSRGVALAS
jgi:hypothetical protein